MAPTAHVLYTRHLIADPSAPKWANRDRVVLSNGHASSILYALLHVSGYKLSISDLQHFRSVESKTPGHPEVHKTEGVEVTTGPLGQGLAQAVGLAIAQANLGATYGDELFNNRTWVFCGDGCLQEGVAYEAISMAGHLRLKNLTVLYDDNHITIDGGIDNSFTEDVGARFKAMGWDVVEVADANSAHTSDLEVIDAALKKAKTKAYSSFGWERWSHAHVGIDTFGDSAAPAVLFKHFGITPENVAAKAADLISKFKGSAVPVLPGLA